MTTRKEHVQDLYEMYSERMNVQITDPDIEYITEDGKIVNASFTIKNEHFAVRAEISFARDLVSGELMRIVDEMRFQVIGNPPNLFRIGSTTYTCRFFDI